MRPPPTDERAPAAWPSAPRVALAAALVHLLVVRVHLGRGVAIRQDSWDLFWQAIPTADLRDRALASLWALHAQPPLWNALNAVLIKTFGPAHLAALHVLHVGLGAASAAMAVLLTHRLTRSNAAAAIAGALVALDPALVMYEAYALYEIFCAALILAAVLACARGASTGATRPLLLALACLTALVLTRSLYHLVVLLAAVAAATALARSRRVVLAAGLALALLPAGWYAKNLAQYGFFGASSWYGIGLWRIAIFGHDTGALLPLLLDGTLRPVVQLSPFTPPSRYQALGFRATSDLPLLGRDDFHNLNVPAISADYATSARRLIAHDPVHYLGNVAIGYGKFVTPSTESDHLIKSRDRMGAHVGVWRVLWGFPVAQRVDRLLPIGSTGSFFLALIPLGIAAQAARTLRRSRRGDPGAVLREEAPMLAAAGLILYTTLVGSGLELGENVRFKVMVEPLLLVCLVVSGSPDGALRQPSSSPGACRFGGPHGPARFRVPCRIQRVLKITAVVYNGSIAS
jgi:hypothetical protein